MGKAFKTYIMIGILQVPTEWQAVAPENPKKEGMVNLFESNTATKEHVKVQAKKLWLDVSCGSDTPEYFKTSDTPKPIHS